MTRLSACLGCGMLVAPGPRCARCRRRHEAERRATRPAYSAVYSSAAYRKLAAECRAAETRCRWCLVPLPYAKRKADHIEPLSLRPDLALDRANLAVACNACNVRRGRNALVPDPEARPAPRVPSPSVSVGDRMAAIFGEADTPTSPTPSVRSADRRQAAAPSARAASRGRTEGVGL
jgi:5-methylcytosine-specific restriction endonuclease McrA